MNSVRFGLSEIPNIIYTGDLICLLPFPQVALQNFANDIFFAIVPS